MDYRAANIKSAKELLDTLKAGEYRYGRYIKKVPNYEPATYYPNGQVIGMKKFDLKPKDIKDQNIEISKKPATDVVISEGKSGKTIGLLNFASAMNPGGGFISGAMAQEEAICQSSTLYNQLKDSKMYLHNRQANLSGLYNHSMNVSKTYFIRNSRNSFIETPVESVVITSAAVNYNRNLSQKEYDSAEDVMRERMEYIINMFIKYNCKVIILGAFGCGVFGNDTYFIAKTWRELLEKYGGYFDKVVFSIFERNGSEKYNIFLKEFK